jgi:thiol-disulfide isomerase/thioredoxin
MNRAERAGRGKPTQAERVAREKRQRAVLYGSLGVLAIVILVAVALASRVPKTASDAPTFARVEVGQQAPDFTVFATSGPFQLSKITDRPTFLELFATWCPHCQRMTAVLDGLYDKYKDRVAFIAVSASEYANDESSPASQADVTDFMNKFNVRYPIAFDPNLDVAKKYLQGGFPTIVLIGADGKVLAINDGELPSADLSSSLDAALAGRPVQSDFGVKRPPTGG